MTGHDWTEFHHATPPNANGDSYQLSLKRCARCHVLTFVRERSDYQAVRFLAATDPWVSGNVRWDHGSCDEEVVRGVMES